MSKVTLMLAATAAALLLPGAARAADMPIAPPPYYAPPPVDFGGWYLRGDIGMTNQRVKKLESSASPDIISESGIGFDSATLFGVGAGYQFNNWFRVDVTGQYRGKANFHGSQSLSYFDSAVGGVVYNANTYTGSKSEALFLVNAYADLGTWWGITPFIGAGVGTSYNRISSFQDVGVSNSGGVSLPGSVTYFKDAGKWNFAWAAHAGLAYRVSPSLTLELAYSYVNLGNAVPGDFASYDGFSSGPTSFKFKDITSHDLKFGVRWMLDAGPDYLPPPPLITKG